MTKTKKRNRPQPLAPPPQSSALRSRKKARQATTLFHKYTQQLDKARASGGNDEDVKKWEEKISEMGGREEYQRASQMNTSLFSTSKWAMGILGRWGWLDGLPISSDGSNDSGYLDCNNLEKCDKTNDNKAQEQNDQNNNSPKPSKKKKIPRRDLRLLEIGAINTQLLDAAARTRIRKINPTATDDSSKNNDASTRTTERVHLIHVDAIDIRSTDPRIQQMDFFELGLPDTKTPSSSSSTSSSTSPKLPYDVLVNSMVINCVTTPAQRGRMLSLCYHQLRPGGVMFLTLPRLCLKQSKSMSKQYFEEILTKGVGFEILEDVARESPKVAFFVLRRPEDGGGSVRKWNDKYTRVSTLFHAKRFRNTFAVTLDKQEVLGQSVGSSEK